jgi:predicted HicB family RNase H-like nuclease
MTILTYNGYQASIDYEDGHLVIQLLHIDDFISTTCDDAREVEETFHKLVDEYLETCRQLGREPKKPYKGSLNIRMPPELHRCIAMAASSARVSLNAWIVAACQEKLASIEGIEAEHSYVPAFGAIAQMQFHSQQAGGNVTDANVTLGNLTVGPVLTSETACGTVEMLAHLKSPVGPVLTSGPAWETVEFNRGVGEIGSGTGWARITPMDPSAAEYLTVRMLAHLKSLTGTRERWK